MGATPKDRWPDSWKKCRDPVVLFVRALYARMGTLTRLGATLQEAGSLHRFQTDWPSTFIHDASGHGRPKHQVPKMSFSRAHFIVWAAG
eukprot:4151303-Amphidinium_carterae.1